jgi:FkbM family methyltransferase
MENSKLVDVAVFNGLKILVPVELQRVFTDFESFSSKYVQRLLKAGDVFVDVGANFGFYSRLASEIVGASGRVIAIEPSPATLNILTQNVAELENVTIVPLAVSTKSGQIDFYHTDDYVNSGSVENPPFIDSSRVTKVSVPSKSLDRILVDDFSLSEIQFLKIDVQGDDVEVLLSCEDVLSKSNDVKILVEWAPTWMINAGRDPMDLPTTLVKLGFKNVCCIDDWLKRETSIEEFYVDYKEDGSGKRFCNIVGSR